jgi:hypothetical protein
MNEALLVLDERGDFRAKFEHARPLVARSVAEAWKLVERRSGPTLWFVGPSSTHVRWSAEHLPGKVLCRRQRLLLPSKTAPGRREFLGTMFGEVVAPDDELRILPVDDLVAVLQEEHPEDFFVGVAADVYDEVVLLYRGNLERLIVPFDSFRKSSRKARPDFSEPEVIDCGQTVRLGADYEAAADAILYEFAPDYRKRLKQSRLKEDRSFGSALQRLRIQRRLGRGDLGLSAKEVARIERGEIRKPHPRTLAVLAKHLRVRPDEIATY